MKTILIALLTILSINIVAQNPTEDIAQIRKMYNYTNANYKKMKRITKNLDTEGAEGGTIDFYYQNNGEYNLIIKTVYNETGKIKTEYYFGINNYLNFILEQTVRYNATITSKSFDEKKSKKTILKYYVRGSNVFKVVDSKNKTIKKTEAFCQTIVDDIRDIIIDNEDKNL